MPSSRGCWLDWRRSRPAREDLQRYFSPTPCIRQANMAELRLATSWLAICTITAIRQMLALCSMYTKYSQCCFTSAKYFITLLSCRSPATSSRCTSYWPTPHQTMSRKIRWNTPGSRQSRYTDLDFCTSLKRDASKHSVRGRCYYGPIRFFIFLF